MKHSDLLTRDEIRLFQQTSAPRAWLCLATNWLLIVAAFALVIVWPNVLTFVIGAIILGGRQLGLAIINHDCAHYAFFANKSFNNFVGQWLTGAPINVSVYDYRAYHLQHHRFAGTDKDPDLWFVQNYPISPQSLKRKIIRDISGRTGIRDTYRKLKQFKIQSQYPWLGFHLLLIGLLSALGAPWAYLVWWLGELFVFPLIMRIRQIGEHGVAANRGGSDPRENTHTTLVSWWERLILAPNHVNFHLEHHCYCSVPGYNLPKLHRLLKSRGWHEGFDCLTQGYINVLKQAVRPAPAAS